MCQPAAQKSPCDALKEGINPDKNSPLKNTLHTNNLLHLESEFISQSKNALAQSGYKNNELIAALKTLQKQTGSFKNMRVDFSQPENDNNLIKIDFTKITKNNPLTVSLKLFLSRSTCPKKIKAYVDIFHKIFIDTIEKGEYASRSECLEQQKKEKEENERKRYESSESGVADTSTISEAPASTSLHPCSKYKIDMLILSLSKNIQNYSIKDYVYKFYEKLEELHDSGRVQNIGLSDLTSEMVQDLEKIARIQPSVLQVKYTSMQNCDSEINNLMRYSEDNDVLLLRHSDETPFLTSEKLNSIAEEAVDQNDSSLGSDGKELETFESIDAVLRYTITSKWHSVLLAKGYFVFEN